MLRGDLNEVQQSALVFYLAESDRRASERDWTRFKLDAIIARPDLAKKIMELDEQAGDGEFAATLSDEEIETYQPLSGEEIDSALSLFESFGLRMASD